MVKKIIVCQSGNRHRYLIPQVLERNGLLYRLYTDTNRFSRGGKLLFAFSKILHLKFIQTKVTKRMPNISLNRLYCSDRLLLKQTISSVTKSMSPQYWKDRYLGFSEDCFNWGIGDSDCIYSMFVENSNFLIDAKKKGVKIGFDMYEAANTNKYLIEEIENNQDYSIYRYLIPRYRLSDDVKSSLIEPLLSAADFYTVPSAFVAQSMKEYRNFDSSKVRIVPYASSITVEEYDYKPIKHRLIWVGNEPVRKGLLYCAKAATVLRERYPDLDFRIIGKVDERLKKMDAFKDLHFIGLLGKKDLINEFKSAEAYVFPTLFEGFAGTVIEAASCGCPIITTENAGTDINEFPAIYIKPKSVQDIVDAVIDVFENESLRNRLSSKVYEYAKILNPASYEKRLIKVLSEI